jgi:NAD+ synthase (glutamine-hydrolysing)
MQTLRIALAQINPTVGDLVGNADKIIAWSQKAREAGAHIVAFPELAITGYPPEDLVLKPDFIAENRRQLERVAATIGEMTAIVGFVDSDGDIYNAAAIIQKGQIVGIHHKFFLPNYSVFDEQRYFKSGDEWAVYIVHGVGIGVTVCEDIWYPIGPGTLQAMAGAQLIVNINASPYRHGVIHQRQRMVATRALDELVYVAYLNTVGGQDELVFEGNSMIFNWNGELLVQGKAFSEDLVLADLDMDALFSARLHDTRRRQTKFPFEIHGGGVRGQIVRTPLAESVAPDERSPIPQRPPSPWNADEEIYNALVLGTHDYVRKNGFKEVVIGLSGGIDSSLTAVIAVDALGPGNVIGVSMPSRYSSEHSRTDAAQLAQNLGIRFFTLPIEGPFAAYLDTLAPVFEGTQPDITEENIQARIRGNLLMALSNKFGWLVLTTGNKSETAVGYNTLYGDTAGGFAVLKDVFKTTVYRLAHWRNTQAGWDLIPRSVLEKPASAELRPNQLDVDSLPPYEILDPILKAYVEEDRSAADIIAMGYPAEIVNHVILLVDRSEYKRRQAPPGIKITTRAFGKDRRLPITNWYHPNGPR